MGRHHAASCVIATGTRKSQHLHLKGIGATRCPFCFSGLYYDMDFDWLENKAKHSVLDPNTLLHSLKLLDPDLRNTPAFRDPRYFPFYYYLGQLTQPKKVIQFGSMHGMIGKCFLHGAKQVERWTVVDEGYVPSGVISANLRPVKTFVLNGLKELSNKGPEKYNLSLVTGRYDDPKPYLETAWDSLEPEGLLVVDYISDNVVGKAFETLCRVKNRQGITFSTRYGVGIITR